MAKGYSKDLRERAVALVEDGESRREAARVLNLAPSTAVRWLDRWTSTGSVEAKPGTGHSRSPLKQHERWLLDLVAREPDCGFRRKRTGIPIQCGHRFRSIADSIPVIADSGSRRRRQGLTPWRSCQVRHALPIFRTACAGSAP